MSGTVVSVGPLRFAWQEWDARVLGAESEWTHPGLAILSDDSVAVVDQTTRELVRLDREGRVVGRVPVEAAVAHGISATRDDRLWVADIGVRVRVVDGEVVRTEEAGAVRQVARDGRTLLALPAPEHPSYADGPYVPTSAVAAEVAGGDVWVADGYGQSLVHRFSATGTYRGSLDGTEGAGRFARPHAVLVDTRGAEPRLLVTDRSNHRVAIYDLDGRFVKLLGDSELRMPSAFAVAGDLLFVVELWSRMAVFDPDDRLIGYLGDGEQAWEEEAWPNQRTADGVARRPVRPGRLNAPHGIGAGSDGSLTIAEWSLGGRIVRLTPAASSARHDTSVPSRA